MSTFTISGSIIDLFKKRIFKGNVSVENGKITKIAETETAENVYILPGFIDAHVHIESSMLVPREFARLATPHGTVGTVSDPHEIANVLGIKGIEYMIENARDLPFTIAFGAPSCVPATDFETAGAEVTSADKEELFAGNPVIECRVSELKRERGDGYAENIGVKIDADIGHLRDELRFDVIIKNPVTKRDHPEQHDQDAEHARGHRGLESIAARKVASSHRLRRQIVGVTLGLIVLVLSHRSERSKTGRSRRYRGRKRRGPATLAGDWSAAGSC